MVPKNDFNKELARQIRAARESRKVKQLEVLAQTRIHVGRIEMGDQAITVYTLYRLCKYLQIDVSTLLTQALSACQSRNESSNLNAQI